MTTEGDPRASGMPAALRSAARWRRLGPAATPVLLAHPDWRERRPFVVWMHGRTAAKELDPGRYLRWIRAGIAACAIDLPGHGERFDDALQQPSSAFDVITRMLDELDGVVNAIGEIACFDSTRVAIGGMSAGGMIALARLCTPHTFACASVEATTGSWEHQAHREMFQDRPPDAGTGLRLNPVRNLDRWQEIPLQAIHARHDEWVSFEGQAAFVEALRQRYRVPETIELVAYAHTGAPHEHIGFGRKASNAKDRQRDFFARWLTSPPAVSARAAATP